MARDVIFRLSNDRRAIFQRLGGIHGMVYGFVLLFGVCEGFDFFRNFQGVQMAGLVGFYLLMLGIWLRQVRIPWTIRINDSEVLFSGPFVNVHATFDKIQFVDELPDYIELRASGRSLRVSKSFDDFDELIRTLDLSPSGADD